MMLAMLAVPLALSGCRRQHEAAPAQQQAQAEGAAGASQAAGASPAAGATPAAGAAAATPGRQQGEPFGRLTIDQVAAKLGKPGVHVFDNNSHDEYLEGHVPTATWVAYNEVTAKDLPADKDATLIFYCHNEH